MANADMFDVVRVGEQGLIGGLEMRGDVASIQVMRKLRSTAPEPR